MVSGLLNPENPVTDKTGVCPGPSAPRLEGERRPHPSRHDARDTETSALPAGAEQRLSSGCQLVPVCPPVWEDTTLRPSTSVAHSRKNPPVVIGYQNSTPI